MTLLLSDPRVAAVPVRDVDGPLAALDPGFGPGKALARRELATRLQSAWAILPSGIYLRIVESYRPAHEQQAIIERYSAEIRAARLGIGEPELHILASAPRSTPPGAVRRPLLRRREGAVPDLPQRSLALRAAPRSDRSRLPSHVCRP